MDLRYGKRVVAFVVLVAAALAMGGCATTERDGVIIEQRRWWHIFSEAEPVPEDDAGNYPS